MKVIKIAKNDSSVSSILLIRYARNGISDYILDGILQKLLVSRSNFFPKRLCMAKYRVVFQDPKDPKKTVSKMVSAKAPDDAVGKTTDFFTKPDDVDSLDKFNSQYKLVSCLPA